ncbi:MAG TPA: penicillin-binding protein 2, partial [Bacteroidia bacterium]|nr:penicillin-binding protein 2 [Bacteroidia bacterium]
MMKPKKQVMLRVYLVYALMCLFGVAIVVQIFRLQFVQGEYWKQKADSLSTAYINIEASRGNILSEDGDLLATSVPVYDLYMDVRAPGITTELFYKKVDSLSLSLSNLFGDRTFAAYKKDLKTAWAERDRYHLLQRKISFKQLIAVKKFPLLRMGRNKGGLIVQQKDKRELPYKLLAARTIGYKVGAVKPVGIEGAFNEELQGVNGLQLMQKIAGNVWMPLNDNNEVEPRNGRDIITTLDVNIQDITEQALYNQLMTHNAEKGCAVVMEVATGKIKSIANLTRMPDGNYSETFNYAVGYSSEPGSTFKLASVMAAFEDGLLDLDDSVETYHGRFQYFNRTMKDSHEGGYGKVSLQKAFAVSSNVGISQLIYRSYAKKPDAFVNHLRRFNLDKKMKLQITGEGIPFIKDTKNKSWSGVSLPWMSIGYEVSLTPLQQLAFYNAVANNGRMVKPKFVDEIRDHGVTVQSFPTEIITDTLCSRSTLAKAKKLLETVVESGTATNIRNNIYKIAGKTGTAQVGYSKLNPDRKVTYQASFAGYFPAENPRYSCIVVIYSPSSGLIYGSEVAAPVFKEISDKVYAMQFELF